MKGRYNGCHMSIYGSIRPGASGLAELSARLSPEAKKRLKWFDYYRNHDNNARRTCRHFDVSPQTFYRWKKRYNPKDITTLEHRSHKPKKVRQPTWSKELVEAVLELRESYPRWGKDKLVVLLRQKGYEISTSMVGRILRKLKERGLLEEPLRFIHARKRAMNRPYGIRKPKDYQAHKPGDIVQVDTMDIRPLPGVVLKQLTARDMISRWDVIEVHTRATASTAAGFLEAIESRMPFPIRAIQVDGGSEFMAEFEESCQDREIKLFVLPPRSPKLNGQVERANRTHTEEFYEVIDSDFTVSDLTEKLMEWEGIYNTVRPHQALGYLTPLQFIQGYEQNYRKEVMCH